MSLPKTDRSVHPRAAPSRAVRRLRATAGVLIATTALAGCIVAPPPRVVAVRPAPVAPPPPGYDDAVIVDVAPPPAYVEVVPPLPYAGAIWIGGYWGWRGGRHLWVPGRYEAARPGYGWRAHAWVQDGGRWRLHEGGWVRR